MSDLSMSFGIFHANALDPWTCVALLTRGASKAWCQILTGGKRVAWLGLNTLKVKHIYII